MGRVGILHALLFDTLCVSFSFFLFKFLVFEAAIYANKDVYIKSTGPRVQGPEFQVKKLKNDFFSVKH